MTAREDRPLILSLLAATLLAWTAACKDADPVTGPSVPAPTPTPTAFDLSGDWTGIFYSPLRECDGASPRVSARATLAQHGSILDGTLDAGAGGCGAQGIVIHAKLVGNHLEGTIESNSGAIPFGPGSTVSGGYCDPALRLDLHDSRGRVIPGGTMQLYR